MRNSKKFVKILLSVLNIQVKNVKKINFCIKNIHKI
jgi:hypothetical protein